MDQQALRAYLDEHLVGASTVVRLVGRRIEDDTSPAWLRTFHEQLEEEHRLVEEVAEHLDTSGVTLEHAAGTAAQVAVRGALRLSEALHESLHDLIEFETMYLGVQGKACLWRTLRIHEDDPALAALDLDLDQLESRAAQQAERLEELRIEAARALKGSTPPTPG